MLVESDFGYITHKQQNSTKDQSISMTNLAKLSAQNTEKAPKEDAQ